MRRRSSWTDPSRQIHVNEMGALVSLAPGLLRSARNDVERSAETSPRHCEARLRRGNPALRRRKTYIRAAALALRTASLSRTTDFGLPAVVGSGLARLVTTTRCLTSPFRNAFRKAS